METIQGALASLHRSRQRSAWVLFACAMLIGVALVVKLFSESPWTTPVLTLASLFMVPVLVYLFVVQVSILVAERHVRRGDTDAGPFGGRVSNRPVTTTILRCL